MGIKPKDEVILHRYVQFPLCAIHKIFEDRTKGINMLIDYGMVKYALSGKISDVTEDRVIRQLFYDLNRHPKRLKPSLLNDLNEIQEDSGSEFHCQLIDEDYAGFYGGDGEFDLEVGGFTENYRKLFETYPRIKADAEQHYRIHMAARFFHITLNASPFPMYKILKQYQEEQEELFGPQPMPMVSYDMLFAFRERTDNPIDELLFCIAIRSIIGSNPCRGTYKSAILMRTIGAKNQKALETAFKKKHLREFHEKYSSRYRYEKMLGRLYLGKYIRAYFGYRRRMWISCTMGMDEAAKWVKSFMASQDIKREHRRVKLILAS